MELAEIFPLIGRHDVVQGQSDRAAERGVGAPTPKLTLRVVLGVLACFVFKLPEKLFDLDVPRLRCGGVAHQSHSFSTICKHRELGLQSHVIVG